MTPATIVALARTLRLAPSGAARALALQALFDAIDALDKAKTHEVV